MRKFQINNLFVGVIIFIFWMILLILQPIRQTISDYKEKQQPSFVVNIEKYTSTHGRPRIKYTRIITVPLTGIWQVYLQDVEGTFLCGGDGTGTYLPNTSGMIYMDWDYFIGKNCAVPEKEYKICTLYSLQKLNETVQHSYGPFCSKTYNTKEDRLK